jgi:CarboxypepD_reg-like domain/TonB-dependent Receptor Plug Domain
MQILTRLLAILLIATTNYAFSQTGIIKGRISNALNNEPLPFATVQIVGTTQGAQSDDNGNYEITGLLPKLYQIKVSIIGFKEINLAEIQITNSKPTILDFAMEENTTEMKTVVIKADPFVKTEESPVSLRNIGISEIARNPGGNRDISKVIQSLPGVTSVASFRNDLIIRGGAPNENRFYLDDVEVPNINHFATQGASGGPVGLINVDFIKEVDFYSGAFPANRGNTLSSVFNFRQRDGRSDKWGFKGTVGASDIGITAEGPINDKTTFLFSARRSYLQFLFKALKLPFLPTYNGFQMKIKHKLNAKNEITFIGLGAVDQFALDTTANKTETQKYQLDFLPESPQWNYTNGLIWKRFDDKGYWTFVLSRNMLNNKSFKYYKNNSNNEKILDYLSQEIENKFRAERTQRFGDYKLTYGIGSEFVKYNNKTYQKFNNTNIYNYQSAFNTLKYNAFAQLAKKVLDNRLTMSFGVRADGTTYNSQMSNPLNQISPRVSLSYAVTPAISVNFNTGIYYQLPAYTVMGFQQNGVFVNKDALKFIRSSHIVGGLEYNTPFDSKITIEGYYKGYENYPFLLGQPSDSIALANLGGDFGVIGNQKAISQAKGRSMGLEFLFQQRIYKGFYGIVAYTLGKSEFQDKKQQYVVSSWDSRHIVALTLGKQLPKNWEIGAKFRFQTGLPYTPDADFSNIKSIWDRAGRALPNYNLLNTERTNNINTLDFRVDKKWFWKTTTLNLYLDIQNALSNSVSRPIQILDLPLDADKNPIGDPIKYTDANGIERYKVKTIQNATGNLLPSIGLTIEF